MKPIPNLQTGNLDNRQKIAICAYKRKYTKKSASEIAEWAEKEFKLATRPDRTTIDRIWKRRNEYENLTPLDLSIKRKRVISEDVLEKALIHWIFQMQHKRIPITVDIIKEKGKKFAQDLHILEPPKFSNGWYHAFATRNGFGRHNIHGESGDAQMEGIDEIIEQIVERIKLYELRDIYNMDETGLFYRMSPDKIIATRQIEGSKKDKTRMTIAFTCNVDGSDRFAPFFIGHYQKPHCFGRKTGEEHGYWYTSNTNAWMTGPLFKEYIQRLSRHIGSNRKILLLIDNASSHIYRNVDVLNIEIVCLPPNTTSRLQPLDAGIIAAFKCQYRKRQLARVLDCIEAEKSKKDVYKASILEAMEWSMAAWRELKQSTLVNCWKHTGLLPNTSPNPPAIDHLVAAEGTEFTAIYDHFLDAAAIQDPIPFAQYINPSSEQQIHIEFTDKEILEAAQAIESEDPEDEEELDGMAVLPYTDLPKEEQVFALAKAVAICEARGRIIGGDNSILVAELRRIQQNIRWEIQDERQQRMHQTIINQYFK